MTTSKKNKKKKISSKNKKKLNEKEIITVSILKADPTEPNTSLII